MVILMVAALLLTTADIAQAQERIGTGQTLILKDQILACDYDVLVEFSKLGDEPVAARALLERSMNEVRCLVLKPGTKVTVEDRAYFRDAVQVRPEGAYASSWVRRSALSVKSTRVN